ncbi:hypothetical protein [Jiulongibacter sediminis]|jgi:hypothetical protein|uniref:transmembrane-type terpene cyclase n=1 Tax=Jiulongibacter sediminis TaxID=1605367 RepID=UPI0026F0D5F7|nr:hypothetical protein [Jiulongibacter sediminis]
METFLRDVIHINTDRYSVPVILLFTFGTCFWIYTYIKVILGILKYKIAEIPMPVAAFNIAWEFCWGFLLVNDYGPIFKYAAMIWFFMDVFINFKLLQYGPKLVTHPWIKKNYKGLYVFFLLGGGCITYFMRTVAEDDGVGIVSAYFISLCISSLYIYQLLNFPQYRNKGFSYGIAWGKFMGTAPVTIGTFLLYPDNHFVHTMAVMVFAMDILYIYLFKKYSPEIPEQTA